MAMATVMTKLCSRSLNSANQEVHFLCKAGRADFIFSSRCMLIRAGGASATRSEGKGVKFLTDGSALNGRQISLLYEGVVL